MNTGLRGSLIEKDKMLLDQILCPRTGEIQVGSRKKLVKTSSVMLLGNLNGEMFACFILRQRIPRGGYIPDEQWNHFIFPSPLARGLG